VGERKIHLLDGAGLLSSGDEVGCTIGLGVVDYLYGFVGCLKEDLKWRRR